MTESRRDCNVIALRGENEEQFMVVVREDQLPRVYGPMKIETARELLTGRLQMIDADERIESARRTLRDTSRKLSFPDAMGAE